MNLELCNIFVVENIHFFINTSQHMKQAITGWEKLDYIKTNRYISIE